MSTTVRYGDTFLILGGNMGHGERNPYAFKYDHDSEGWSRAPGRMTKGRSSVSAFLVRPEMFANCRP